MALIAIEGPNAIKAVKELQKALGADSVPAWDLSPMVPDVVRADIVNALTPAEAIQFLDRAAYENHWIYHSGWFARFLTPAEGDVEGVPI